LDRIAPSSVIPESREAESSGTAAPALKGDPGPLAALAFEMTMLVVGGEPQGAR